MQKSAFERTGLVPRSIIRTFDRFRRQLLPGAEDLVIQEFRVSKYQVLVSVRCLASLLFFPLLVNYLVKTTILIPLAEYIWNTQQNEIFLNFYQENRAFLEMRDFEEKTFFEFLVSTKPRQNNFETLVSHKIQNDSDLIANFCPPKTLVALPQLISDPMSCGNFVEDTMVPQEKTHKSAKEIAFYPLKRNLFHTNLRTGSFDFSKTFREEGAFTKKEGDHFIDLPQTSSICEKDIFLEGDNSKNKTKNHSNRNKISNCTLNFKDSFLNLPQRTDISGLFPTELKEFNLNKIESKEFNFSPKSHFEKVFPNLLPINQFLLENKKEIDQNSDGKDTTFQRKEGLQQLCDNHKVFVSQKEEATLLKFTKNHLLSFENEKARPQEDLLPGEARGFPKIDDILLQKKFQEKTIQLATFYNQQTISAIANVFGDFVTLITIAFLSVLMKPQIIILKSFLTESIYSLSDTTKSFLLILLTDLLVGFHSPRGWEILIEILLRHFGLPENQDFVFLFVATLPVLLDTVFKYWIFRYLNQISPSTVATYHSMIE